MPELPEVETMCRGIAAVVGGRVTDVQRPPCQRRPILFTPNLAAFHRRIVGHKIAGIGRLGKRVLIHLDDAQVIVIEPRMTGLVLVADPPTIEHLRLKLLIDGAGHDELFFWDRRGLGTVRLLTAAEADLFQGLSHIGPDALAIDCGDLRTRLAASKRTIKVALLDQKIVAGIGNLYAAEILHVAGVDPRVLCNHLSKPQWERIHAAFSLVLEEAIRHEGSTLSDGTYRNALNQSGGYQNMHRVYDREGQPCRRCGGTIRRIVQVQRSTFFCPVCQTRSGLHQTLKQVEN